MKYLTYTDLSEVSHSFHSIYNILYAVYKEQYTPKERIAFYSGEIPSPELIAHIQQAATTIDISHCFILIECPHDITTPTEIEFVKKDVTSGKLSTEYKRSNAICPLPWTHAEVRNNGDIAPCCVYTEPTSYNINVNSIAEYYHSNETNSLRQKMTDGKIPTGCKTCFLKEASGNESNRKWAKGRFAKNMNTQSLEASMDRVVSLDLKIGNLCNLRCNICNYKWSSSKATEHIKLIPADREMVKAYNSLSEWVKNDDIWADLETMSITNLEIYGGEPFMGSYHTKFLDRLIELRKAKDISIHYNTNGTIFPKDLVNVWKHFKHVNISFSLDDLGYRWEYQRNGSFWFHVEDNLARYNALRSQNLSFSIFPTVNIQNILYMPEFIEEMRKYNWPIHFNLLTDPSELSIFQMPENVQELILQKFSRYDIPILDALRTTVSNAQIDNDVTATLKHIDDIDDVRSIGSITRRFNEDHPEMDAALRKNT